MDISTLYEEDSKKHRGFFNAIEYREFIGVRKPSMVCSVSVSQMWVLPQFVRCQLHSMVKNCFAAASCIRERLEICGDATAYQRSQRYPSNIISGMNETENTMEIKKIRFQSGDRDCKSDFPRKCWMMSCGARIVDDDICQSTSD